MFIKELFLKNFRNFSLIKLSFNNRIVFFFGGNAQGKTNLLEAIYYLSNFRSFRTYYDEELIKIDEDFAEIQASVEEKGEIEKLRVFLKKNGNRSIFLNNREIRKMREIIGKLNVVLFSRSDLSIISGEKEKRREFLDREIPQFIPSYYFYLHQYQHILHQRNQLLKETRGKIKDFLNISSWDEHLAEKGVEIIKKRKEFLKKLSLHFSKYYKLLSENEDLLLIYSPSIETEDKEEYLKILLANLEDDLKFTFTQLGPHRDDLKFQIQNKELRKFGSAGEQRCAALALRLGLLKLFKEEKENSPILLLDDVFSELDYSRRNFLKDLILQEVNSQVFITSSEDLKLFKDVEIFKIENNLAIKL